MKIKNKPRNFLLCKSTTNSPTNLIQGPYFPYLLFRQKKRRLALLLLIYPPLTVYHGYVHVKKKGLWGIN